MPVTYGDPNAARSATATADGVVDARTTYELLMDIARRYGADEIKHLTRAYQAIRPHGGGGIEDLRSLLS